VLTLYLLYWFIVATESFLGDIIRAVMSDEFYRPGMGVVAGLVVAFVVGLLMQTLIVRRMFLLIERCGVPGAAHKVGVSLDP